MPELLQQLPPDLREKYEQAVQAETFSRNSAFLSLTETVAGYEVRPLTLRDYLLLRAVKSPVLFSATPTLADLAGFLWLLNPAYDLRHPARGRRRFLKSLRRFAPPGALPRPGLLGWRVRRWLWARGKAAVVRQWLAMECRRYLNEAFMDAPPAKGAPDRHVKSYYADATGLCALLAREFGWDDEATLDKPMKRLFQYLKELKARAGPSPVLFNPSDRILNEYINRLNSHPVEDGSISIPVGHPEVTPSITTTHTEATPSPSDDQPV